MKTISFVVPCYNSSSYMDACIESILPLGEDIEIVIVNDGSSDDTLQKAHAWEQRYPDIVRAIDQENLGHGGAVNRGLAESKGLYFKVVDSDDWLDARAMEPIMIYLRSQVGRNEMTDLVVGNYLYDKSDVGKRQTMSYTNVFPTDREFAWNDIRRFRPSQYLLMHSVIYRHDLLSSIGLTLPEHCFYVDNIFVYVPLPHVRTIRYFDVDMYHYYIGREDQSVNEQVMLSRIDQQLRITKEMIDAVDLGEVASPEPAGYMYNYLSMMMCICSVFLRMEPTSENEAKRAEVWSYLATRRPGMYARIRGGVLNLPTNLPTEVGRALSLGLYRISQKVFKFN